MKTVVKTLFPPQLFAFRDVMSSGCCLVVVVVVVVAVG